MKRVLALILALTMMLSLLSFAALADEEQTGASFTPGQPVKLPDTLSETIPEEGVSVWDGEVDFGSAVSAVTFVFRVTGVEQPIVATKVNPTFEETDGQTYSWSDSVEKKGGNEYGGWQWGNIWGSDNAAIFAPELPIAEDGVYYLYLNRKVLANDQPLSIQKVTGFSLFCTLGGYPGSKAKPANPNTNATFQMLNIVPNDLSATVEFYDGQELLTTQSISYTEVGNNSAHDQKTGIADGINPRLAKQFHKLTTPTELFLRNEDGAVLPSKDGDGQNLYRLVWKDENGDVVDGVYQDCKLYADYEPVDKTVVDVTFLDADGKAIYSETGIKKTEVAYKGENPVKAADDDYTYTFVGWTTDGGKNVIRDFDSYTAPEDAVSLVFSPVFAEDLILKATLDGPDGIPSGGQAAYQVRLNRTDVTTDVAAGVKEKITSGQVVVCYPAAALSAEGQEIDGGVASVRVPFDSVDEDGVVGQLTLTASGNFVGPVTLTVSANAGGVDAQPVTVSVKVQGDLQPGLYLDGGESVSIAHADANNRPAKQDLWSGSVPTDNAHAISYVFKLEGVKDPINAYQLSVGFNGTVTDRNIWTYWFFYNTNNWGGGRSPRFQTFEKDGYYVLYLHNRLLQDYAISEINSLSIFANAACNIDGGAAPEHDTPMNTNDNATFTMLAVIGEALAPTVTFHDAQGDPIGDPYTYKYIDESAFSKGGDGKYNVSAELKQMLELVSAEDVFDAASAAEDAALAQAGEPSDKVYVTPAKEQDDYYNYKFAGWADENGNPVDAVYKSMDLYPIYEKDIRFPVEVTFVVDGKPSGTVVIPRGLTPTYTGSTKPTKPSDEYSYLFAGWTADPEKTLATSHEDAEAWGQDLSEIIVTENITLYAVFERTERIWEVTFYTEDHTTELGKVLVRKGELIDSEGNPAEPPTAPEKPATQQYTYAFAEWVDDVGNKVDLHKVGQDIDVYASYTATLNKYTVTFLDEDKKTELGTSTVDYGTAATAPENPTKAEDEYYTYTFDKWVYEDGDPADVIQVLGDMTVYASYTATFKNPFADADLSRYYGPAVEYVTAHGIMNGTDATHFSPNGTATRGMIVTVLYRMEGSPGVEGMENKFTDVPEGKYYTDAVKWASNVGVVNGTGDNTFSPNNNVTREQFATMIYRYAGEIKGYYMSCGNASLNIFADKNDISTYATTAVKWAIASEKDMSGQGITYYNKTALIEGIKVDENTVNMNPKGNATRGQMATMLYRFITGDHLDASEAE